jgi:regulator of protease activity HflC (stomatin/prohibitin superfamily)
VNGWIIFSIIAIPVVLGVLWILADDSIVRVPSGSLGLLMVRGRATNTALEPGTHWVPRLRRHMVEIYPSTEGVYRAGGSGDSVPGSLDFFGPLISVRLGDRAHGTAAFTVRVRLDPDHLRDVHNRFGKSGWWSAVRDLSSKAVRSALNDPAVSVDDLFGERRHALEARITEQLHATMLEEGFIVSHFSLDNVDLGRAEDAIQSAVRARLELAREEAEFEMRLERVRRDAAISKAAEGANLDTALRYREADAWAELASQMARESGLIPDPPSRSPAAAAPMPSPASTEEAPATGEEPS